MQKTEREYGKMNTAEYIEFLEGEIQSLTELINNEDYAPEQEVKLRCERNRLADTLYTVSENDTIQKDDWKLCADEMPENLQTVIGVYVNHEPEPYYAGIKDEPFTAPFVYFGGEWHWWSNTVGDWLAEYGKADWEKIDKAIEVICWKPMPKPPIPF